MTIDFAPKILYIVYDKNKYTTYSIGGKHEKEV